MKCSKCFNECRDDLFFCNICGAPLLNDNFGAKTIYTNKPLNNNFNPQNAAAENENIVIPPIGAVNDGVNAQAYEPAASAKVSAAEEYPPMKREKAVEFTPAPARTEQQIKVKTEVKAEKKEFVQGTNKNAKGAVSRGQFVAMELLLYVPIVNLILLFLLSFNKQTNPTMRNYAVAKLICVPLLFVAFVIIAVILFVTGAFDSMIAALESYVI